MKFSKKFIEDLHKIGEWAFIEKNMWVGKLVPEIIVDNLKKRGITPDDLEGVVCLTVEEAKILETFCWGCASLLSTEEDAVHDKLVKRIEQAEKGHE